MILAAMLRQPGGGAEAETEKGVTSFDCGLDEGGRGRMRRNDQILVIFER